MFFVEFLCWAEFETFWFTRMYGITCTFNPAPSVGPYFEVFVINPYPPLLCSLFGLFRMQILRSTRVVIQFPSISPKLLGLSLLFFGKKRFSPILARAVPSVRAMTRGRTGRSWTKFLVYSLFSLLTLVCFSIALRKNEMG